MKKSISKKINHFFFLYIYIAFLFSACSFRSEDKLLSQLIENWDNIPSNHQNISNLNSFLDDFERYKESDEYYVNTMINQNYLNNVKILKKAFIDFQRQIIKLIIIIIIQRVQNCSCVLQRKTIPYQKRQ